ncbi:hypothetical protein HanPI659440_Chr08g0289911 [Helianthus annuus]|nr:hypothetical protein HanPI659440_Chr08g0289911 [Helianthus annuus]
MTTTMKITFPLCASSVVLDSIARGKSLLGLLLKIVMILTQLRTPPKVCSSLVAYGLGFLYIEIDRFLYILGPFGWHFKV